MTDWLQLHKDRKAEFADLYQRMDDDAKLITNVKYVMRGLDEKPVPHVTGVMTNRPAIFAAFVEASLNRADEKVTVESDDESLDTAVIEDAIKRLFIQANLRRRQQGSPNVEPYIDQQSCLRGRAVQPLLIQESDEGITIDMPKWDARYVTYAYGVNGLKFAACEMKKTRAMLESEAWAVKKGITLSGKTGDVVDIWTEEEHLIYLDGVKVLEESHIFGFVPVVVQIVPIGLMFSDDGILKNEGESIFALIRYLISEFNRLVSIMQTHNMRSLFGSTQEYVKDGGDSHNPTEINTPNANVPVDAPGAISLIPYTEVRQSAILLLKELSVALDDGSLSRITLGQLPGPMSAVALVQVEQGQGQVFMPRLGNRGLAKQALAEMAIAEMEALGLTKFELGNPGHKNQINMADLEGEYNISYVYSARTPETDFARWSLARQVEGKLDDETILRDIVKRDDPEGDLAKLRRQQLRGISRTLVIYDGLEALAKLYEDGDKTMAAEIDIVEAELGVDIDEILAGKVPFGAGGTKPPTEEALPTFGIGGGRSSAKKAADLIRSPPDDIEEGA